jgi:two-component system sensor histidine kinase RegB
LAFYSEPTPWPPGISIELPLSYKLICSLADAVGVAFGFGFGWWSARQAARMEFALHLTDTFLARQQRLSALGGLAAAAAHELGTPLTTIAVIAKEMARDAPDGPLRDDAWLLVEQAGRCRDILRRLARAPETSDVLHERIDLASLVEEIAAPYVARGRPTVLAIVAGPPSQPAPELSRRPELMPAMASIVENAVDFAIGEVRITARYDARSEIFARLGEPYVTSRADAEPPRDGHVGMGLGLFIARTLLERSGARVTFANGRPHGAVVAARWPRAVIEAPPAPPMRGDATGAPPARRPA